MSNELHDDILELLDKNGAMGVNQLQKALNIPLSTLQKYLDKQQSYFKKTPSRKWDLPERVNELQLGGMSDNVSTIIDSQLTGVNATFDLLNQQIKSILTLSASLKPLTHPPVARSSQKSTNHPKIEELINRANVMTNAIKKNKDKIPEEYQELMLGGDYIALYVDKGITRTEEMIAPALAALILGETDSLDYEVVKDLKTYQKGA